MYKNLLPRQAEKLSIYSIIMSRVYSVILKRSEEGYAVGCPMLPGCWSQGATEEEAVDEFKKLL